MEKDELLTTDIDVRLQQAALEGKQDKNENCNHGIVFDVEEANKILSNWAPASTVEFIMGNPAASKIRKRFPRLCGLCPKGCGYNGIYYASEEHYIAGDW